jgi:hypothetical protein
MREPTRIPASLNEEDLFLSLGPIKLSMREMLAFAIGLSTWYMVGKIIGVQIFGAQLFGLILLSPVLYVTWVIGKKKKEGKPFEQWLADKIVFSFESRQYTLLDKRDYTEAVDDVKFTIEDEESGGYF